jgi:hypothetical protein
MLREQLAALETGAAPHYPIVVTSAAVIEGRALTRPCPHCGGENRLVEHTRPWRGIRRVDVECRHCSAPRTLWFRLVEHEPAAN